MSNAIASSSSATHTPSRRWRNSTGSRSRRSSLSPLPSTDRHPTSPPVFTDNPGDASSSRSGVTPPSGAIRGTTPVASGSVSTGRLSVGVDDGGSSVSGVDPEELTEDESISVISSVSASRGDAHPPEGGSSSSSRASSSRRHHAVTGGFSGRYNGEDSRNESSPLPANYPFHTTTTHALLRFLCQLLMYELHESNNGVAVVTTVMQRPPSPPRRTAMSRSTPAKGRGLSWSSGADPLGPRDAVAMAFQEQLVAHLLSELQRAPLQADRCVSVCMCMCLYVCMCVCVRAHVCVCVCTIRGGGLFL